MMAAGADSPSTVATQSAKTDILQKIGQGGNNHQTKLELAELHEEDLSEEAGEEKVETQNNVERRSETTTPAHHQQLAAATAAANSALEVSPPKKIQSKRKVLWKTYGSYPWSITAARLETPHYETWLMLCLFCTEDS